MATLFYSFPPDERRRMFSAQTLCLSTLENGLDVRSWYCKKMPILCVCVDIHERILSALTEAENIPQKSGCPHFCNSIRNISIKNHRLYHMVARQMRNFLHSWYRHPVMQFIELIYLFQLTKDIVSCFNFSLEFFDLYLQSSLFWYLPQLHHYVYYTDHFVYHIMSLQVLHDLHPPTRVP